MNNGWHEIEAMLPPLGMLVWVLEEDGNIVLAKRFDTGTGMWAWSTIGVNLFKTENGEIMALNSNYIKLNPKYWHELPQLPNIEK